MMAINLRRTIFLVLLLSSFFPIWLLNQGIDYERRIEGLSEDLVLMPGDFISGFVATGFKGIAADLLWLRVDEYWHEGEYYKIFPLLRTITWLQRNFIDAWALGSWHLAYNISPHAKDTEAVVQDAISFLEEGISKNAARFDLYFELGWLYYNRLHRYDEAIRYFGMAAMFKHPSYVDRLIAHAYHKLGDFDAERRQWQECSKLFPDDKNHQAVVKRFLERQK